MNTIFTPGTIVNTRNRLWRVDSQHKNVMWATPIDGDSSDQQQFYVPLEQIQRSQLPTPSADLVGYPSAQDLLLRAYRLNMIHGTAPLLSLQRSRAIPKDYQLVPVIMGLEMPRVRLLIADDVGLGKTVEAGLMITELMARQMARRILIVVPAALREQWKEALEYFFHLDGRIISSRHRRQMERELPVGSNPWAYYNVLITSLDYAKQPAIKNQILEQSWDLVLFDEAHLVARPHSNSGDATTDRWELAEEIAKSKRIRHLLLLTATPHNGYTDSFASLLELLDVGAVIREPGRIRIARPIAQRHVCQRRRQDVDEWFSSDPERSPFAQRDQDEVIVVPTSYEAAAIEAVRNYGRNILRNASGQKAQTGILAKWTVLHLHKRALSSPEALRQSLKNRQKKLELMLENKLEEDASVPASEARASVLDEFTSERLTEEEVTYRTERFAFGTAEALRAELAELSMVLEKAEDVTARRDGKLTKLLDSTLRSMLGRDPKVVIFTRYVDTMNYVSKEIGKHKLYKGVDILTIHGGLNERQRLEIFQKFDRTERAVLVATDAISEGINLQHAAAQVVHYELPWNPNRLEQRNGRVDRFGQKRPTVTIRTMVMNETLDATILKVLVRKAAQIRQDYGFSPPYFGEDTDIIELIEDHDIKLAPKQMSLFDMGIPKSTRGGDKQDPFDTNTLDRIKSESFYGQAGISLSDVEKRLEETAATIGSPQAVKTFVFSALSYFQCPVKENKNGTWEIRIVHPSLQTTATGSVIERATFNAELGLDDPDTTVLDLGHPLVRRLIEEIKQSTFRNLSKNETNYGRTCYKVVAEAAEATAIFHLLVRYSVQTTPVTILETLLPVALPIYGDTPLFKEQVARLLEAQPKPITFMADEIREYQEDALDNESLDTVFAKAVADQRDTLIEERRNLRERLTAQNEREPSWVVGLDELSEGNFDILTMTMFIPAVGG